VAFRTAASGLPWQSQVASIYSSATENCCACQVSFDAFCRFHSYRAGCDAKHYRQVSGNYWFARSPITGHFDTKSIPGSPFVGANDGGTSTGLLLELARTVNSIAAPR